jgi:sulfide:quinone oxidoreductase
VVVDRVVGVEPDRKVVRLSNGELGYDYLFIALGMHKVKMNGLENTLSICGAPDQAVAIGNELDKLVERGSGSIAIGFGGNPKDDTASAVRGGPAFELLFNVSTYLKKKGIRDKFQLHFFAPMAEPGKKMGSKAMQNLDKFFKHYGIESHVGTKITGFNKGEILFEGDKTLTSDLIIFIAGGAGHESLVDSGLPLSEAGFVKTLPTCQVEGHPTIYAIGDSAQLLGPAWAAKQGHMAEIMADVAAYNAHQQIMGSGKTKSYVDKVSIVCVMDSGDGAAFVSRTSQEGNHGDASRCGALVEKSVGFLLQKFKTEAYSAYPRHVTKILFKTWKNIAIIQVYIQPTTR